MIPPGLSFLAFSEKALQIHEQTKMPRFYWDVSLGVKYLEKGQTPFTPAVSLFFGLGESLKMMLEEGLDNIIERHCNYRCLLYTSLFPAEKAPPLAS